MYIISGSELEKGDIILTSENSATSKIVRKSTKSCFSHAILYVGSSSYIHSDANGVHSGNLQRLLFEAPENVTILRVTCSLEAINKACMFARLKIGTKYSIKDAVNAKIKTSKKENKNRQFCSRLVVQAYEHAGIRLVDNTSFCTPQEILESKRAQEVFIKVRKATNEEIDLSKNECPIKKQSIIINKILKEVRKITKKDIQTLGQITTYVISNPQHDKDISNIYKKSGYLTIWEDEISLNPWRYNGEIFLNVTLSKAELILLAKAEKENAIERLTLYKYNFEQYFHINERYNLEYSRTHLELYHQLLKNTLDNIDAANYVLERV